MTELSKLEQEILAEVFEKEKLILFDSTAKVIAELCRKKIELAFDAGYKRMGWEEGITWNHPKPTKEEPNKDQWIKEHL